MNLSIERGGVLGAPLQKGGGASLLVKRGVNLPREQTRV